MELGTYTNNGETIMNLDLINTVMQIIIIILFIGIMVRDYIRYKKTKALNKERTNIRERDFSDYADKARDRYKSSYGSLVAGADVTCGKDSTVTADSIPAMYLFYDENGDTASGNFNIITFQSGKHQNVEKILDELFNSVDKEFTKDRDMITTSPVYLCYKVYFENNWIEKVIYNYTNYRDINNFVRSKKGKVNG